jgi:Beta-ketoacyl synthase, N-terminal domain
MTITITGVGAITPFGAGAAALWSSLCRPALAGANAASFSAPVPVARVTSELPDAATARKSGSGLPRATRLALESARQAWGLAKLDQRGIEPERTGVFVASSCGLLDELALFESQLDERNLSAAKPYVYQELTLGALAGHVSIQHGIRGPALPLAGTWRSGFQVLEFAVAALLHGEVDAALVVATESGGESLALQARRLFDHGLLGSGGSGPRASESSVAFVLERAPARSGDQPQGGSFPRLVHDALQGALPTTTWPEAEPSIASLSSAISSVADLGPASTPWREPAECTWPGSVFTRLGWTGSCAGPLGLAALVSALDALRTDPSAMVVSPDPQRHLSTAPAPSPLFRLVLDSNTGALVGGNACTPHSET